MTTASVENVATEMKDPVIYAVAEDLATVLAAMGSLQEAGTGIEAGLNGALAAMVSDDETFLSFVSLQLLVFLSMLFK